MLTTDSDQPKRQTYLSNLDSKEKEQKEDNHHVMMAWKKLLDALVAGFEEGLKAARDEAGEGGGVDLLFSSRILAV